MSTDKKSELSDFLNQQYLCESLTLREVNMLLDFTDLVEFQKGQIIADIGEVGEALYFVVRGEAALVYENEGQTIELGRMAVQNRVFPLMEVEGGTRWRFTMDSAGDPVGPYIRAQGRFKHLTDEDVARIQKDVDARYAYLERMVRSSE